MSTQVSPRLTRSGTTDCSRLNAPSGSANTRVVADRRPATSTRRPDARAAADADTSSGASSTVPVTDGGLPAVIPVAPAATGVAAAIGCTLAPTVTASRNADSTDTVRPDTRTIPSGNARPRTAR